MNIPNSFKDAPKELSHWHLMSLTFDISNYEFCQKKFEISKIFIIRSQSSLYLQMSTNHMPNICKCQQILCQIFANVNKSYAKY